MRLKFRTYEIPTILKDAGVTCFNLCTFGELGNGKSSTINTIISALLDQSEYPCQIAECGESEESFTRTLAKYELFQTVPIKIWDVWGWQTTKTYKELQSLIEGKLKTNFKEGDNQTANNSYFTTESNIKLTPHAYITICDIYSVFNPSKIKQFRNFYQTFKQDNQRPTFVAMTKFDKLSNDNGETLLGTNMEKILDYGAIIETIEGFAEAAKISPFDIFPVINYQGVLEPRNFIKDFIALKLLDRAIYGIETYFRKNKLIRVIDQFDESHGVLILDNLDLDLQTFESAQLKGITHENFYPDGFYDLKGKLISCQDHRKHSLEEILFNVKFADGYVSYTVKIKNRKAGNSNFEEKKDDVPSNSLVQNTLNSTKRVAVIVSYDKSLKMTEQKVFSHGSLGDLRQKINLSNELGFSKNSKSFQETYLEEEELSKNVEDALDSHGKIYVMKRLPNKTKDKIKVKVTTTTKIKNIYFYIFLWQMTNSLLGSDKLLLWYQGRVNTSK